MFVDLECFTITHSESSFDIAKTIVSVGLNYTWRCICVVCEADVYFLFVSILPL